MGIRDSLTKLRVLVWLSYQIEANWTRLPSYLAYISIRPTFTLLLMIFIVIAARPNPQYGFFILVGQAFYNLVGSGVMGVAYTLWDDREHYRSLKYVYLTPNSLTFYLIGRGLYKFIEGLLPLSIAFFVGALLIHYPIFSLMPNWPMLIANYFVGMIWIIAFGLLIASFLIFTTDYGWAAVESIVSSLLLFGNVIFPTYLLPYPLDAIANFLPIKYWMDINRQALLGMSTMNMMPNFIPLLELSLIYFVVAFFLFKYCERVARSKGLIDITTAH
ncbi:MAG TPA: ABC transporter permease [Geobacterales bacterium]|nr:ABC transporter permease [Geobacterales bacterium]